MKKLIVAAVMAFGVLSATAQNKIGYINTDELIGVMPEAEKADAELKEYQGDFYSTELETKYIISVKDSSLQIKIPRNVELEVSPLIKDIFFGDLNIRFSRNKKKSIDGFFLSTGRVRNLRFAKMNSNSF
jgi:hypothetical protein